MSSYAQSIFIYDSNSYQLNGLKDLCFVNKAFLTQTVSKLEIHFFWNELICFNLISNVISNGNTHAWRPGDASLVYIN